MKVVASGIFFINKDKKYALEKSSFRQVVKDFTGYVLFYDWNENLQYGARYQIGHYIGEVSPVSTTNNARLAKTNLVCEPTYIDWYDRTCVGDVCTDWQYSHTDVSLNCYATPGGTEPGSGGIPATNPGEPTGIGGTGSTGNQPVNYILVGREHQ